MHFSSLTSDELSTVLENLSAKQLFSLSNTSRELRVAARQALNAPRFAEGNERGVYDRGVYEPEGRSVSPLGFEPRT